MTEQRERAATPEDLSRLIIERVNARDLDGLVALYEPDAVLAYPPGSQTVGREAIRSVYERLLAGGVRFQPETPLPTLVHDGVALTATVARDEAGARAQLARRQADGTWLRVLDRPDFRA